MRLVLQVKPGGRKIWLSQGQKVCVGRTDEADFVVPDDEELLVAHFAIRCDATACFLQDLSGGGTFLNGEKVSDAAVMLNDGDEIQAGQTRFAVYVQAAPMDSRLIPPELQAKLAEAQRRDIREKRPETDG